MAKQVTKYESDGVTEAQSSYDEGTVNDGATTTARRAWWKNTSTNSETLEDCRFLRAQVGANDGYTMLQIAEDSPVSAPGAPSLALQAGSELEVGDYDYRVTFVTANGETTGGTLAEITTTGGNERVNLTSIPTGPTGVTKRRIYRTTVGGSQLKLVAEIADNVTTTYLDQVADGSLGANIPTLNTSGSADTWGAGPIEIGDITVGDYAACWMRYSVPSDTSQVGNPRRAYVQFEET